MFWIIIIGVIAVILYVKFVEPQFIGDLSNTQPSTSQQQNGQYPRKHFGQSKKISEAEFKQRLTKFLMTGKQLADNGYPYWGCSYPKKASIDFHRTSYYGVDPPKCWIADNDMRRTCSRCYQVFFLNPLGIMQKESCVYHVKRAFADREKENQEIHPCCKGIKGSKGCISHHTHVSSTLRESEMGKFVAAPEAKQWTTDRSEKVYAMDCEMVETVWGPALGRITVVNMNDTAVLDLIVKPDHPVIDYNTKFSGLTEASMRNATADLKEAQRRLFNLINADTYLIGHGLENDMKALRLVHERIIDTSIVFPHRNGSYKRSLRQLASSVLKKTIQNNVGGHDSKEDASTCMQLMIHKVSNKFIPKRNETEQKLRGAHQKSL